jgi:hypothetical protein
MSDPEPPPLPPSQPEYVASVRLPDYYADSPQAWFCSIDATFAASRVRKLLTKFNWALSKLPFSLIISIGPLCKRPVSYPDPYQELQDILLRSCGLSASLRTGKWLDHLGCSNNRPTVKWDNLTGLQPATVKEVQTPFPPQIAALHQGPDQPAQVPGIRGPYPAV